MLDTACKILQPSLRKVGWESCIAIWEQRRFCSKDTGINDFYAHILNFPIFLDELFAHTSSIQVSLCRSVLQVLRFLLSASPFSNSVSALRDNGGSMIRFFFFFFFAGSLTSKSRPNWKRIQWSRRAKEKEKKRSLEERDASSSNELL